MIFLRRHDAFQEIAILASPTSEPEFVDRAALDSSAQICGVFSVLEELFIATFRYSGTLYLRWGSGVYLWEAPLLIERSLTESGWVSLRLEGPDVSESASYRAPTIDPPLSDIFEPFSEEEDLDFGLFLSNLSSNPRRRNRIFSSGPVP